MHSLPTRGLAALLLCSTAALPACGGEDPAAPEVDELVVTTTSLPNAVQGQPYDETLRATGGDASYRWAILGAMAASPPSGIWLSATGNLTGTPLFAETRGFTVEVRSGDGQSATRELSITVSASPR